MYVSRFLLHQWLTQTFYGGWFVPFVLSRWLGENTNIECVFFSCRRVGRAKTRHILRENTTFRGCQHDIFIYNCRVVVFVLAGINMSCWRPFCLSVVFSPRQHDIYWICRVVMLAGRKHDKRKNDIFNIVCAGRAKTRKNDRTTNKLRQHDIFKATNTKTRQINMSCCQPLNVVFFA